MTRSFSKALPVLLATLLCASSCRSTHEEIGDAELAPVYDAANFVRPGFVTELADIGGSTILWVFREGSEALEEFRTSGEPAKNVTLIGAGPDGISLRGPDRETLDAYRATN